MPLQQVVAWLRQWWWVPLLAVALPVLVTWPAIDLASNHVLNRPTDPDLGCGLWWPEAFASSVLALENPFFREELAWPYGQDTRLLLWNFLPQIVMMPLVWLGRPLAMNVATFLWASLNGLACGWLGWTVSRSRVGVLVGLVAGSTTIYAFFEGASGRPEQALFAPVALYLGAWQLLNEGSTRSRQVLAGLSLALAGATYWFYAYFLILLSPLLARRLRDLLIVGGLSFVFVLPFLLPVACGLAEADNSYRMMIETHGDPVENAIYASVSLDAWMGGFGPPVFDLVSRFSMLTLPVILWGLWRRQWRLVALVALTTILAMGYFLLVNGSPVMWEGRRLWMPMALLRWLPGWERFWWPYRWLGVALPALAALSAVVARRPWQGVVLALVLIGEASSSFGAVRWTHYPAPHQVEDPVVLVPLGDTSNALVGLLVTGTRVDAGLAFNSGSGMRGEAWEQRRATLPLMAAIDAIQQGQEVEPLTPEELAEGGFRTVVVQRAKVGKEQLQSFEGLFGEPVHEGMLVIFELPGPRQ